MFRNHCVHCVKRGDKVHMDDVSSTLKVSENYHFLTVTHNINFELFSVSYLMRDVQESPWFRIC